MSLLQPLSPLQQSLNKLQTRRLPDGSLLLNVSCFASRLFGMTVIGQYMNATAWVLADDLVVGDHIGQIRRCTDWDVIETKPCIYVGLDRDEHIFNYTQPVLQSSGSLFHMQSRMICCLVLPTTAAAPAIDLSRFPDKCLRCGAPAYLGGGIGECSRAGCR